ncbi:MAG: hypothetical protein K2H88_02555 [Duncaniella sp.]|nr:hypothetical protein [Duncaniella sp.]MDE5919042.1 hypothetical protein [Duncaniella sp.]MDE6359041.1 hypothetical protein [Duncaniella sp.]
MKALLASLLLVCTLGPASLMADNTMRGKRLKVEHPEHLRASADVTAGHDTVFHPSDGTVTLSGYDKPLNSSKETLLVTNRSDCHINGLRIAIRYLDLHGRELHSTEVELHSNIPAGATRKLQFPSWDIQRSYYYHLGKQPRTANVTPYTVKCHTVYFITKH